MGQPQNYYIQTFPSFKVKVHYTFQYRPLMVQAILNQAPLGEWSEFRRYLVPLYGVNANPNRVEQP